MPDNGNKLKISAALLMIVAAVAWGWRGWNSVQPSSAINNGSLARGFGPPRMTETSSTQQQGRPRDPMMGFDLTEEQRKQVQAARAEANGNPQAMRQAMDKILTSEQRQKMRERMEQRRTEMDARMKRSMSASDYAALQRKRERGEMGPGPRGGGPPDGGPPPEGGPPPGAPVRDI